MRKGLLALTMLCALPAWGGDLDQRFCGGLTAGLRYSAPINFSAPVGMLMGPCPDDDDDDKGLFGALIELEPGTAGGRVSAGFFIAHRPGPWEGLFPLAWRTFSLSVKLTYVETWGDPHVSQVKPDQTYIGFEQTLAIGDFSHPWRHRHSERDHSRHRPGAFEFTLGYLHRIRDRGNSADNQLLAGFGYVF